jgi:predicted nucleic acid-binding protein
MILADSSVWIDFFRAGNIEFEHLLDRQQIATHPFVIGEVALGSLRNPRKTISIMQSMPQAEVASHDEVMHFLDAAELAGKGIGYVDIHLLASTRIAGDMTLWTRDHRLAAAAAELNIAHSLPN